jgi:hypothetical protein
MVIRRGDAHNSPQLGRGRPLNTVRPVSLVATADSAAGSTVRIPDDSIVAPLVWLDDTIG